MADFFNRLKATRERLRKQVLSGTTHYEVLGVPPGADEATIRATHRYLASAFHPDRCGLADAQDLMARVNVAYTTLTDKEARRKYDALHRKAGAECATCRGKGVVLRQKGFSAKVERACPTCGGTGRGIN